MNKIKTIIRKEWAEVFKNRMVLFTVVFLPLILTALPIGILYAMGSDTSLSSATIRLPQAMSAGCPRRSDRRRMFPSYMVSQFMMMFMLLPLAIPAAISAYSIVGEKANHSLEPLLATPITTWELLVGKSLAAVIPAVGATYGAFLIFAVASYIMIPNKLLVAALLDLRWLLAIFLVGPLMAIMAVNVSIMVSSRVNDPRAAEQLSMVVILPVMGVFFAQLAGLFLINTPFVLISRVVIALVDVGLTYLAVNLFQRENILTRWK